jgi:hypothetical protein
MGLPLQSMAENIFSITSKKLIFYFLLNLHPFPSLLLGCNRQAKKLPVISGYIQTRVEKKEMGV